MTVINISENHGFKSEYTYRSLFEEVKDAVYYSTPDGRLMDINQAGITLFGYPSKEKMLKVQIAKDLYVNAEDREYLNKRLNEDGYVENYELQLRRLDGEIIYVTESAVKVVDNNGNVVGYRGILHDITHQKLAEIELRLTLTKLRKALEGTIKAMATTTEACDLYTASHQKRVSKLATAIAKEMRLPKHIIEGIRLAGLIHDLGKISVPAEILSKPGKLNMNEFEIIKKHIHVGYDILKSVEFPWPIAQIVLQHQERYDGSGYPAGLKKDEILIEARVLGIADVIEAMAFHRPYREALGLDTALKEIKDNRGIRYDPDAADACLRLFLKKRFSFDK